MTNVARIEMSWKLYQQGVRVDQIAVAVDRHRATVFRWIKGIKHHHGNSGLHYANLSAYLKTYRQAKQRSRKKQIPPDTERLLASKRRETHWCGQKLAWWLEVKHNIKVSVATVYRLLQRLGFTLSSKWVKWTKRPKLPRATKPREFIQVDKIDLGFLWVHNFIDCFTREVVSVVVTDEGSKSAFDAGKLAWRHFGSIDWLQSDNGSEYKKHFNKLKGWHQNRRRITPGKKEENGFVESFNRTLRSECVGWGYYLPEQKLALQDRIDDYLVKYHTERPHLGLNLKTPQEVIQSHLT